MSSHSLFCSLCQRILFICCFFFFNDTATTEIYTLSLHDALPICAMTRILVSGIERTNAAIRRRWTCGFCDVTQSVSSPVARETDATHARGSIAFGMSRWLRSGWRTTVAADLNAASVAALSPIVQ